jgi:hypothetical protein
MKTCLGGWARPTKSQNQKPGGPCPPHKSQMSLAQALIELLPHPAKSCTVSQDFWSRERESTWFEPANDRPGGPILKWHGFAGADGKRSRRRRRESTLSLSKCKSVSGGWRGARALIHPPEESCATDGSDRLLPAAGQEPIALVVASFPEVVAGGARRTAGVNGCVGPSAAS